MKSESWSWNWIPFLKIWLHCGACQILTVQLSFGFHGPTNPPCVFPILRWISVTFHFFHCDKQCYSKHPHKFILLPCIILSKWVPQGGIAISSVQLLSCVFLWPHELQHARAPCPSPTPRVYSNSCPLSQWCHPAISSSVVPFSSCL